MGTKRLRRHVRHLLAWAAAAGDDVRLLLSGERDRDLPPMRLRFVGAGDFRSVGEELQKLLVRFGLRARDRVLDIGSGVGRVAIPLTRYLGAEGTYDGFDIVRRGVRWCRRHITSVHPNFRFHHVKVRSSEYRESGAPASGFRFPFDDASFDFAFATSLFTHLVLAETRQYLRESARVLAPGGRLLATFFLLNDHSRAVLPLLDRHYRFPVDRHPLRLADAANPAVGVAIDEDVLVDLILEAGFSSYEIHYGQWAARPDGVTFQDLVLCRR
ncbi:MAG TPA: class I SAM-dependent methyltransferase [Thermoanaerobaculia bacterium]|nr:class I SAM-dependent methyltransferase [Thermoanaerobaculia bacterium]